MIDIAVRLLAGAVLVLANAFFVVTEFALTRLRQFDREELGDSPGLRKAWAMTERLEIYLTGCQLGITTSSILLGVVTEPAVTALLEGAVGVTGLGAGSRHLLSIVVAVILINLVHKIWGEQAPTYLGVERPLQVLHRLAPALWWWTKVAKPVILLGDGLAKATLGLFGVEISRSWTEEGPEEGPITSYVELRQRLGTLLERGQVGRERRREIVRALEIQDIPVSEIMVPRGEIRALSTERPIEENFALIAEHGHARFPLVGSDVDDALGTIYVPALFGALDALRAGRTSLEELAVSPLRFEPDLAVSEAIDRFQEARQELAFVTEEGRVLGLVTSTDAFEAIAGELEDPLD